jgi:hypothetical protein
VRGWGGIGGGVRINTFSLFVSSFVDKRKNFYSPLSRPECVRRLNSEMDRGWVIFGKQPIIGHASNLRLRARVRISYRNSFQTILHAKLEEWEPGTRFVCRFGVRTFVKIFMGIWFGFVVLFGALAIIPTAAFLFGIRSNNVSNDPMVAAFTLLMVGSGIGLNAFCRWLARDEQGELIEFICKTTNATERSLPIAR